MVDYEIRSMTGRLAPTPYSQSTTRASSQASHAHIGKRSSSTSTFSAIHPSSNLRSFSSPTSLTDVMGTCKASQVQCNSNSPRSRNRQSRQSMKGCRPPTLHPASKRKPQIQVVIPNEERDEKPLPTSPFFRKPTHNHDQFTSGETEVTYNVSPPSASGHMMVRNSIVSPLSLQQAYPRPLFHAPVKYKSSKSDMASLELSIGAGTSSDDSRGEDDDDYDGASLYSGRSSYTSAEADMKSTEQQPQSIHRRARSDPSIAAPANAGACSSPPCETTKSDTSETRHPASPSLLRSYPHHPPIEQDHEFIPSCSLRHMRVAPGIPPCQMPTIQTPIHHSDYASLASEQDMVRVSQAFEGSNPRELSTGLHSPTLSEAENELELQLSSFSDDNAFEWDDKWDDLFIQQQTPLSPQGLARADSVTYAIPPSVPPQVPRKSSKRSTLVEHSGFRLSRVPEDHIVSQLKRRSQQKAKGLSIRIPESRRMTDDTFVLSPIPIPPKDVKRSITPEVAEGVIFHILRNLESLDDLFSFAIVNRGFYRVFKRNELGLMKAALQRMSPPAWELREICYPGHDQLEEQDLDRPRQDYTPESYIRYYVHDMYTIAAIKSLIKDKCQSFMRPEISMAIVSENLEESARVDDALWRIWTFCKIFGSGRGREEDIVAQMDWLKGGETVHQKSCTHSALFSDDMNETLASAPECFAKGNGDGLSAEQLFDMMELWNCLGVLLQPIEGRTIQAREHGIYDNTNVRGGDIDGEEMLLDEWYYYLLTLGLSTILNLTEPSSKPDASVFVVATLSGWTRWDPPISGGTRRHFLKEAASRVYEDKIALTYAENANKDVQRALSKQRIQRHISELRQRKNSGERLDVIRMSQERPISEWEGVINSLTRPRPLLTSSNNIVSHIPSLRSANGLNRETSISVPELPATRTPSPLPRAQSPPRRIVAQPLLPTPPPSTVPSTRDRSSLALSDTHPPFRRSDTVPEMPRLDEHPAFALHMHEQNIGSPHYPSSSTSYSHSQRSSPSVDSQAVFQQHPLQRMMHDDGCIENTVDRAIYRIVEMGFTPEQARQALRKTDLGDGLRVDRAVELLLRET